MARNIRKHGAGPGRAVAQEREVPGCSERHSSLYRVLWWVGRLEGRNFLIISIWCFQCIWCFYWFLESKKFPTRVLKDLPSLWAPFQARKGKVTTSFSTIQDNGGQVRAHSHDFRVVCPEIRGVLFYAFHGGQLDLSFLTHANDRGLATSVF